jgi:hypothetical protein
VYHIPAASDKNLEIKVNQGCIACHVPNRIGWNRFVVGVWHYDQKHFDYWDKCCRFVFFVNNAVAYFSEQA